MAASASCKRGIAAGLVVLLGDRPAPEFQQQRACLFGLGSGGQDSPVVGLEQLQPMLDVAGVADEMGYRQTQLSAEHGTRQFRDEFLRRVGGGAEAVLEI